MPIKAHAEQDEVEAIRKLDVGRAQRVDLLFGNRNPGEQRLARKLLVRAIVVGRHVALIAPPDVPARPVAVLLR